MKITNELLEAARQHAIEFIKTYAEKDPQDFLLADDQIIHNINTTIDEYQATHISMRIAASIERYQNDEREHFWRIILLKHGDKFLIPPFPLSDTYPGYQSWLQFVKEN